VEDDVHFEYVISLEQQTAAEAQAAAAQARADAQAEAQRAREQAQQIREQAQRIREEVAQRIRVEQGQGAGQGVIVLPPTPPPWQRNEIPPQAVDIVTMFIIATVICIVGLPIARAIGRWIDRRGLPSPVNADLGAQMNRIEQAVDSMSIEVERISEAQRFQAKLLSDREKVRA
jgi:multidrug efflux pump subunit AcrA (membrane-fusion protein)